MHGLMEQPSNAQSKCPRCSARQASDQYGDAFCLMCGWYGYTRAPTDEDQARKAVHLTSPGPDWSHRDKRSRLDAVVLRVPWYAGRGNAGWGTAPSSEWFTFRLWGRKASTKAARHTVDSNGGMWNWAVHRVVIDRPLQKMHLTRSSLSTLYPLLDAAVEAQTGFVLRMGTVARSILEDAEIDSDLKNAV